MGGIDKTRFTGLSKTEAEELTCGICLAILVNPVVTHCCQQTYCSDCIKQWLKTGNTCPNDNSSLDETGLMPACRVVINILNKLQVSCDYFANGCQQLMALENLKTHVVVCEHKPEAKCDVCGYKTDGESEQSSHDCSKNLLNKIETLEKSNEKLKTLNECLEENYQLLNKKNMDLVRESKDKTTKIERLMNINVKIRQQLSELKAKIMPLFEDIEATIDKNVTNERQLITHANHNTPHMKWSKIQLKLDNFQFGVFTQYSESRIIRSHPWRIMCQITFNKAKKFKCFGFYLQCNEKSANQWAFNVCAELSIISQMHGCDSFCRKFESVCSNEKRELGFSPFAQWNSIVNPNNGLLKNGSLILEAMFSVV